MAWQGALPVSGGFASLLPLVEKAGAGEGFFSICGTPAVQVSSAASQPAGPLAGNKGRERSLTGGNALHLRDPIGNPPAHNTVTRLPLLSGEAFLFPYE